MQFFDSHCHIQLSQFDEDREAMLVRLQEAATGAVVVGTDLGESIDALALAKQHDFLWAAVGLHPNDNVTEQWIDIASQMEELARHPKVVAIGECGLDYMNSAITPEEKLAQKEKFLVQGDLAQKVHKALVIHCRNAHNDMLTILDTKVRVEKKWQMPIVIHFCTVTGEVAQKYLDLGCYLSFPGPVTYTAMYDESIRVTPLDKLLSETDSPFAAPVPFRGKRNEPSYVSHVAAKLALIKEMDLPDMAAQIVQNSKKVFNLAV